jgi:membrane-associated phospholipid phosphatase
LVLPLVRRRLRLSPVVTAAAVGAAPVAVAIAVPRSRRRDAVIYALQMWAFIVIHELPYDDPRALTERVRIDYPIAVDRRLGLGVTPTIRLQRFLCRPGRTRVFDPVLVWVHWLWFLEPHTVCAWILWRHPERFARAAVLISSLFHLGALVYIVVPTAPPWWAAEHGRLPECRRLMLEVGERFWGDLWPRLYDFLGGNPVAAMPSLHFSSSVMAAHVLSEVGSVAGALGWAYAGILGFSLVYLGEHYLIDLLAGLALAEAVRSFGPRVATALPPVLKSMRALEQRTGIG